MHLFLPLVAPRAFSAIIVPKARLSVCKLLCTFAVFKTKEKTYTTRAVMNIGNRIKEVLKEQGHTAKWLSEQIPCERTNVYDIFHRSDMNIVLLARICVVLQHDFFAELSAETFKEG